MRTDGEVLESAAFEGEVIESSAEGEALDSAAFDASS